MFNLKVNVNLLVDVPVSHNSHRTKFYKLVFQITVIRSLMWCQKKKKKISALLLSGIK